MADRRRPEVPPWQRMGLVRPEARRRLAVVAALALMRGALRRPAAPANAIRIGGPSAPAESKVAIVGSSRGLAGKPFLVLTATGRLRGEDGSSGHRAPRPLVARLRRQAPFGSLTAGTYRVRVPALGLTSRPWIVRSGGSGNAIDQILRFFAANRDGNEPSPIHDPSHLHDATVQGGAARRRAPRPDRRLDGRRRHDPLRADDLVRRRGRSRPRRASTRCRAPELDAEADVGIRWLVKAHPAPGLFIGQVGDQRDHDLGFRDPAGDDASPKPGIGHRRRAYPGIAGGGIGGDIAGKAATALALAYDRTQQLDRPCPGSRVVRGRAGGRQANAGAARRLLP